VGVKLLRALLAAMLIWVAGCAPTRSTGTLPVEVLVVLDSTESALVLIPVDSTHVNRKVSIARLPFVPTRLATNGPLALIAGSQPSTGAALVDLATGAILQQWALLVGTVGAVTLPAEDHGFVAISSATAVARLDINGSDLPTLIAAPGGPQGFAVSRGKVFAVIGNRLGCLPTSCALGPSWLVQVESGLPRDSIPLSGPGNAGPAVVGPDGNLYVVSAGPPLGGGEGRLSIIDPVRNVEVASFAGIGPVAPSWVASDGGERVLIVSPAGGLMAFNTRLRRLSLPFGSGIPLEFPSGLVTDAAGRTYVLQRGTCGSPANGRVRVFGTTLIEQQQINGVVCPIAGAMAELPAERIFTAAQ
jgi:hypothetical protein